MAVGAVEGTDSAAYGRGANGWPTGFDHWQGKPESVPPMSSYDQFGSPMPDAESNGMSRAAYPPPGGYDLAGHRQPPPPPLVGGPPNWHLHRSMSTPDAGGLHPHHHHHPGAPIDMGGSSSMAEKKRNKLGYHRTSVACSHCRRRKIRCIPSADDSQGRCSNCIRLKKDCSFIPTEQQQGGAGDPSRMRRSAGDANSEPSSPSVADNAGSARPSPPAYPPLPGGVAGLPVPGSGDDRTMGPLSASGAPYGGLDHTMPPWGNPAYEGDPMWNNPWQPRPLNAPLRDPGSATDPGPPPGAGPPGPWESGASGAASADAAPRDLPSSWGQVPIADGRSFSYSGESIGSSTQDPAQYVPVGRQPSGSAAPGAGAAPGAPPPPGFPEAYPPGMPIGGPPPPGSDPSQQMQWMQQQTYIRQTQGAYGSWVPGQPRPE